MAAPNRIVAASIILFSASAAAFTQTPSSPTWGTASESSEVVSAWDMQTLDSFMPWNGSNNYRWLINGGAFYGGLHIPNGAVIDSIELDACDNSDFGAVLAGILRSTGDLSIPLVTVSTGETETDGCSRWVMDLPTPETVDTQTYNYSITATNHPFQGTTTIGSVRVYYHLQVSPPPGIATFNDVPTNHPFFQFVEALAASGITAGCGGGNFCPDAPLTRGQIAVFFAKALGLHWPVGSQTN